MAFASEPLTSPDMLTAFHNFVGDFFPAFGHDDIFHLEIRAIIVNDKTALSISFQTGIGNHYREDGPWYTFEIHDDANIYICSNRIIKMSNPNWASEMVKQLAECTKEDRWCCDGCKYS
jgi:hypothetical protein